MTRMVKLGCTHELPCDDTKKPRLAGARGVSRRSEEDSRRSGQRFEFGHDFSLSAGAELFGDLAILEDEQGGN